MNLHNKKFQNHKMNQSTYNQIKARAWGAPFALLVFGGMVSMVCVRFESAIFAWVVLVISTGSSAYSFLNAQKYVHQSQWTHKLLSLTSATVASYLLIVVMSVANYLMSFSSVLIFITVLVFSTASYVQYYKREQQRAWEAKSKQNERRILDLDRSTYKQPEFFYRGEVESLGWDDRLFRAVAHLGIGGGAVLGVTLSHHVNASATSLIVGGIAFVAMLLFTRLAIQRYVDYEKIREYEKQIGRPIVNAS